MKSILLFRNLAITILLLSASMVANSQTTYNLVTDASQLVSGAKYLFVGKDASNTYWAMGKQNNNSRPAFVVTESSGAIMLSPATMATDSTKPFEITIEGATGTWTLFDAVSNKYVAPRTTDSNGLPGSNSPVAYSITFDANGLATLIATGSAYPRPDLRFNRTDATIPVFSSYLTSNLLETITHFYLYKNGDAPSTNPNLIITSPADGATINAHNVTINFSILNFVLGTDGKLKYSVNNETAEFITAPTTTSIPLTDLSDGPYTVDFELVDMADASLATPIIRTLTFTINNAGPTITPISTIQQGQVNGTYENQTVTVEGIVTFIQYKVSTTNPAQHGLQEGYYIQDASTSWSGIYVYDNQHTPAVGNTVRVTAKVVEYYEMTELTTITAYEVTDITSIVPTPIQINCLTGNDEQYESCYVKLCDFTVTASGAYGNFTVADANGTYTLNKAYQIYSNNLAINGTHYFAKGIINFNDVFRLMPDELSTTDCNFGLTSVDMSILENTDVYPNPANDYINIKTENKISKLQIINSIGQIVKEQHNVENGETISINELNSGLYLIKMTIGNEMKLIKINKE
ncbi:MAG: T9SS type A sorting domain-containing protein [Bacteroidales bacterium]|nr:T9SS type A sorting domain-containing protein [Bacteroidales bacterium]